MSLPLQADTTVCLKERLPLPVQIDSRQAAVVQELPPTSLVLAPLTPFLMVTITAGKGFPAALSLSHWQAMVALGIKDLPLLMVKWKVMPGLK